MKVYVIGMGVGNPALLTGEALDAAKSCRVLVGARRLLEAFPGAAQKIEASSPARMAEAVRAHEGIPPC